MTEQQIEQALIEKLSDLKYTYRPELRDRAALEPNKLHNPHKKLEQCPDLFVHKLLHLCPSHNR